MSPALEGTLKTAGTTAASALAGVVVAHGFPTDVQGWLGMLGAILVSVGSLFVTAPQNKAIVAAAKGNS